MNIISRLRKAIAGFDNPLARVILFGLSKNAVWTPADYYSLSKAGYENCMAVYACVNLIARSSAGIEWTASVNEKDAPKHPILKLLSRPNEDEGRRQFITKCFAFYLISGNRYVLAGRIGTQPPLALWVPRPDKMKVLPGGRGQLVAGYEYGTPGQLPPIDPALVMHSKLFHPTDDFYGLSPLSVAAHAVDISNMSAEWNARLLQNDMRPPGALSTEGRLDDAQFKRLKSMMKEEWQGYENAGQPLLLEGGLKWTNFMLTAKEMDWLNTTKFNRRDIATVFNVDPCLIGDSEYATYSNKIEARKGLYEDNIIPLMDELCDDFNAWLAPMFGNGVTLGINKDKIPALQESREKQYSYLQGTWWLRIDELRKLTGQDPVGGSKGEMILIPIGKIPLELAAVNEPEPEPEPDIPDSIPDEEPAADDDTEPVKSAKIAPLNKGFWSAPEKKKALWDSFVARIEAKERGLVGMAKSFLIRQAKDTGERVRKAGSLSEIIPDRVVDIAGDSKRYAREMRAWYVDSFIRAGAAGVQASKGEIPDMEQKANLFNITPTQKAKLDAMILDSGTEISRTTMRIIRDKLINAQGQDILPTVEEFTQELIKTLEDFAQFRCRRIARTETSKVENWGQVEGYRETEFVDMKGWLCSFVPESRATHMDADGQEVGLNDSFDVGGEQLDYPGDPKGSAGEVVNCLCATYPIVAGT